MSSENYESPILPVVRQPRGLPYFLGTWSGRILSINTIVFILMAIKQPSSLLLPDQELIRLFGAKNLADMALGEYWRLFTPMFVHIGAIHFVFNMMGLYYIGYQMESMLGSGWFLLLYLMAGLAGNISSCLFSVTSSAGASGALFGLLGAGFLLESVVSKRLTKEFGQRPRKRIYAGMVILNVILGIFISVIDNAAHMGGLIAGGFFAQGFLWLKPNQLVRKRPILGRSVFVMLIGVMICGGIYASMPRIVLNRLMQASIKAESIQEARYYVSGALRIEPENPRALLQAGRIFIYEGNSSGGLSYVQKAINHGATDESVASLIQDLKLTGHDFEAQTVAKMVSQRLNI